MSYAFWNNPLVVSAARVKYRRSSPGISAAIYLTLLSIVAGLLFHYQDAFSLASGLVFLLVMLSLQMVLSGGIAVTTVASSINAEVLNRTLDFQRIVSLSPREILVGKMLGEPAAAYFLLIATIPLAVLSWFAGSASPLVISLFYINLLTTTLLCAAIGTIHTFVPAANATTSKRNSGSVGLGLIWVPLFVLPQIFGRNAGWLNDSWFGTLLNLLTPIGSLKFLYEGNPWTATITMWGIGIPSLLIAPVAQLAVCYWIVTAMAKRLQNPVDPPFSRLSIYSALTLFDLLVAGYCHSQWLNGERPERLLFQFGLAHSIASLVLLLGATPRKAALQSWLWRFEGRQSWLRDSMFGSRAEVTAMLPIFAGIGTATLLLGLYCPTMLSDSAASRPAPISLVVEVLLVSSAVTIAGGLLYQVCVALASTGGFMIYVVCVLTINIVPWIVALCMIYPQPLRKVEGQSAAALSLSPVAYFGSNMSAGGIAGLPAPLLLIAASILAGWSLFVIRKWLSIQRAVIHRKLTQMKEKGTNPRLD